MGREARVKFRDIDTLEKCSLSFEETKDKEATHFSDSFYTERVLYETIHPGETKSKTRCFQQLKSARLSCQQDGL